MQGWREGGRKGDVFICRKDELEEREENGLITNDERPNA